MTRPRIFRLALAILAAFLLVGALAGLRAQQPQRSRFRFIGGTEKLTPECYGLVEVTTTALNYVCSENSVSIPYSAIKLMQYRPDISRKVWKMKFDWKVRPAVMTPLRRGKKNRYFTIVYDNNGVPGALILEVEPPAMRPYLAEIDLKSGKRVEVMSHEEY